MVSDEPSTLWYHGRLEAQMHRPASTRFGGPGGSGGFSGFGIGSGAPMPRDLIAVLASLFITFSLQFFEATAIIPALLRLTPAILGGFIWQVVTYPFIGWGGSGLWFLLELLILFWFGRDVFWRLGRRRFWQLTARAALGAALVAVLVLLLERLAGWSDGGMGAFQLMQGQRILLAITIAAFATLWGEATILLFFVLPVRARWFLWLEILFAFVAFLGSGDPRFGVPKDLAGFVGICTAVAVTYLLLSPGGPQRTLHDLRKRLEVRWIQWRLKQLRRKRPFDVIDGGDDRDRWVH